MNLDPQDLKQIQNLTVFTQQFPQKKTNFTNTKWIKICKLLKRICHRNTCQLST